MELNRSPHEIAINSSINKIEETEVSEGIPIIFYRIPTDLDRIPIGVCIGNM